MENPREGENKQTSHTWPDTPHVSAPISPPHHIASVTTPFVPPEPVVSADMPPAPILPPAAPPTLSEPTPVVASVTPPVDNDPNQPHTSRSSTIILQWLTYAFWGWTVLTLSGLTSAVFLRLIDGDSSTFTYYVIAAIIVLLPVSFACDIVYSKNEPDKKIGPSSLVMIVHAVIFAIFSIGSLLFAAWSIVALLTNKLDRSSIVAELLSALVIFGFYVATFMRTLNPSHISWIPKVYRFTMLGIIILFVILGFAKPTFHHGVSSPSFRDSSTADPGSSPSTQANPNNSSSNTFGSNGELEPTPIGGTQCDNPTLSDGSTTGQMAVSGGATCTDADSVIQGANGKNGANYSSGGYNCTGTRQGSNTQWSSYWNNNFYTYSCADGSSQVAFNLQTSAQSNTPAAVTD